jgi:NAD(P)-dependent dehydrogenase (short-subunit alcohol dehydrogenase family)
VTLANKTIVVLGGSSGIGLATAKAAMDDGARVIITGRLQTRLHRARAELGSEVRAIALDVADEAGMRTLFGDLPKVDHIFVSAATVTLGGGLAPDTEKLRPEMDTRFWGSIYAAKYGAPKMPRDGSITFCSGTSAWRPIPGSGGVGAASCGAVEALARSLAVDLAPIRVNAVAPGLIDTPLIADVLGAAAGAVMESEAKRLPVRRVGMGADIAEAVLFLMKNGFTTGITLTVDGGRTLV